MGTVYVDSTVGDDLRRERLFCRGVVRLLARANSAALCSLARDMAQEAFAPHDPPVAQDSMTPRTTRRSSPTSSRGSSITRGPRS